MPTPYSLDDISHVGGSPDFSEVWLGAMISIMAIKDDGLQVLFVDNIRYLREFTLGDPWDVTDALSFTGNANFKGTVSAIKNLEGGWMNPAGTRAYGITGSVIGLGTFSTGWDTSTLADSGVSKTISTGDTNHCICCRADESYLYIGTIEGNVYQYEFGTPGSLSTLNTTAIASFDAGTDVRNIDVSPDGTRMVVGNSAATIKEFSFSDPDDISTETEENSVSNPGSFMPGNYNLMGLQYGDNGTKLYAVIYEWNNDNSQELHHFYLADSDNNSSSSSVSSLSTLSSSSDGIPDEPTNLSATTISSTSVELSWTVTGQAHSHVVIDQASSENGPWTQIASVPKETSSYLVSGLTPSQTYHFRFQAVRR